MASVNKKVLSNTALTGTATSGVTAIENMHVDLVFTINCTALGAGTSMVAKVQHSNDGALWFDLITFTALTNTGSELKVPTVPALGQLRTVQTFTGGATTSTAVITMHMRNTRST